MVFWKLSSLHAKSSDYGANKSPPKLMVIEYLWSNIQAKYFFSFFIIKYIRTKNKSFNDYFIPGSKYTRLCNCTLRQDLEMQWWWCWFSGLWLIDVIVEDLQLQSWNVIIYTTHGCYFVMRTSVFFQGHLINFINVFADVQYGQVSFYIWYYISRGLCLHLTRILW